MPAPDIPAILATLVKHEVELIVIGGVAVGHHGYVRSTKDIDIVPEPSDENLERLWHALSEMEAEPLLLADFRPQDLPVPFTLDSLHDHGSWDLATKFGRVDILQYVFGKLETADDYEGLAERAHEAHFDFGAVLFTGYEDLLDFKTLAGRDQDLIDIRALREARGDIGPR
ncbi:MAG: hypothetical protein ABR521_05985 [Gaiellaceae bacterium]